MKRLIIVFLLSVFTFSSLIGLSSAQAAEDDSSNEDAIRELAIAEYVRFVDDVYAFYNRDDGDQWQSRIEIAYISVASLLEIMSGKSDVFECDLALENSQRVYSIILQTIDGSYLLSCTYSADFREVEVLFFAEGTRKQRFDLRFAERNNDEQALVYSYINSSDLAETTYRSLNVYIDGNEPLSFSLRTLGEVTEFVFDAKQWANGKDYSWSRELLYESEAAETDDDEQNDADIEAAADFEASVDALPDPHAVTLDDELEIRAVREAYAELSDGAKALVDQAALQKLEDCEAALQRIKDAIDHDPVPSGEGGGFTPSYPTYQATITKTEHGEVTVNPETPEFGDKVTVTVKPDDGYELDELTVTDQLGCKITLTDHSDGTFSFKQPAQKVTITATFKVKAPVNCFDDISEDMYCYDAVLWAYYAEPKITNGMDDTHFGPDETSTRAHIVTFLWRAKGEPEPTETHNPFEDVKETDYFYEAVLWAVEQGIVKGTDETHFTPKQTCSTAHIITMLYRALGAGTDGWYEEAGAWAEKLGLLADTGLTVDKNVDCPRGAIVTFLYRALAKG